MLLLVDFDLERENGRYALPVQAVGGEEGVVVLLVDFDFEGEMAGRLVRTLRLM